MLKALSSLLLAGVLAGCSSAPESERGKPDGAPAKGGCYQSGWQAETIPIINKRLGPAGLEKYDPEHQSQAPGCP